jgi:hypothetical protein
MNTTKGSSFIKINEALSNKLCSQEEIKESRESIIRPIWSFANTLSSHPLYQKNDESNSDVIGSLLSNLDKSKAIKINLKEEPSVVRSPQICITDCPFDLVIPNETYTSNIDDFLDFSTASDFEEVDINERRQTNFERHDEEDSYLTTWSNVQDIPILTMENMVSWLTGKPS